MAGWQEARRAAGLVCVYVCVGEGGGPGLQEEEGGCRVCVLRVAAVFACDYPL